MKRLAVLLLLVAAPASAHDAPYSFLNLRFAPGGASGTLTAHVVDLAHELPGAAPESLLAAGARPPGSGRGCSRLLASRVAIVGDGDTLRLSYVSAAPDSERNGIALSFALAGDVPLPTSRSRRGSSPTTRSTRPTSTPTSATRCATRTWSTRANPRVTFTTGAAPRLRDRRAAVRPCRDPPHLHRPDHILFVVGLLLWAASSAGCSRS
jgi:hypothetical protein